MLNYRGGDHFVWVGDSITAQSWYGFTALSLEQRLNAATPPRFHVGDRGVSVAASPGPVAAVNHAIAYPIVSVNSGVSGNVAANVAAAVAARITNHGPQKVIIELGLNDAIAILAGSETLGQFQTAYDSILSQVRAWSATVPIGCVSALWDGEQWNSGPLRWANGAIDATIDAVNAIIAGLCVTYGATYLDGRGPSLIYERDHNTPEPGQPSGFLTGDGQHPNHPGDDFLGETFFPSFAVQG